VVVVSIIIRIIAPWVACDSRRLCGKRGKRKGDLFYEWSENGRISDQLYASDRSLGI
jgi:hypothetical protein